MGGPGMVGGEGYRLHLGLAGLQGLHGVGGLWAL